MFLSARPSLFHQRFPTYFHSWQIFRLHPLHSLERCSRFCVPFSPPALVRCTNTGRLFGVTSPTSTPQVLLQHRDLVLQAVHTIYGAVSDVVPQQKWKWARIHNVSLVQYMGRGGSLRKLRDELEAENAGVHIPAGIRWLGGAKVRARFQETRSGSSSVVAAVLGEAVFSRLCRGWIRLLGGRYEVGAASPTKGARGQGA